MWLFTTSGFISVVLKSEGILKVRARDEKSLLEISQQTDQKIQKTPLADYPYRIEIGHDQFVEWAAAQIKEIQYRNFKSEVASSRGKSFAGALSDVWSTMHAVEDSRARKREGHE